MRLKSCLKRHGISRLPEIAGDKTSKKPFKRYPIGYYYDTHRQLEEHLAAFLDAYNFAKRLKTLRGLTPYEAICKAWADTPASFRYDPFGTEHLEQIPVNFTHSQRA
jgi:hypothetical protein